MSVTTHSPTRPVLTTDVLNNPRSVVECWTHTNKQLIHDDVFGLWFAFSIATDLNPYSLQRHLLLRAHAASRRCGLSEFNTSPTRVKHRGCCAFLLPATSYAGFPHYHGMVRVPREYGTTEKVMCIHEEGKDKRICVPESVKSFLTSPPFALLNIHVLNEDVLDGISRAVPLHEHPDLASRRALDYWTHRSDGELRRFDEAEWVPWNVRAALPNADTAKQGVW